MLSANPAAVPVIRNKRDVLSGPESTLSSELYLLTQGIRKWQPSNKVNSNKFQVEVSYPTLGVVGLTSSYSLMDS